MNIYTNFEDKQIARICRYFEQYQHADLDKLSDIYHHDVVFIDPVTRIDGVDALAAYFRSGRKGLLSCRFEFRQIQRFDDRAVLEWDMLMSHRKLNAGQTITVSGVSVLKLEEDTGQIIFHRDYFDLGEMLYENLPVLGWVIRAIKKKATHN